MMAEQRSVVGMIIKASTKERKFMAVTILAKSNDSLLINWKAISICITIHRIEYYFGTETALRGKNLNEAETTQIRILKQNVAKMKNKSRER